MDARYPSVQTTAAVAASAMAHPVSQPVNAMNIILELTVVTRVRMGELSINLAPVMCVILDLPATGNVLDMAHVKMEHVSVILPGGVCIKYCTAMYFPSAMFKISFAT